MPATTYNLRRFALLLSRVESNKFTGRIACSSVVQKCQLYFKAGELVHAVAGVQTGEKVIYDLLNWSDGLFVIENGQTTPEHSLDSHEVAVFRDTVAFFQANGRFDTEAEAVQASAAKKPTEPPTAQVQPVSTPKASEAAPVLSGVDPAAPMETIRAVSLPATGPLDPVFKSISKPVEWGATLEANPAMAAPVKVNKPGLPAPIEVRLAPGEASREAEMEQPVVLSIAAAPPVIAPIVTKLVTLPVENNHNAFKQLMPPGALVEKRAFDSGELGKLVSEFSVAHPNSYLLISLKQEQQWHFGLITIEQGQPSMCRYNRENETSKGQAAYDCLDNLVANGAGELNVYKSDFKLLTCYRALMSGNYVVSNAPTHNLDVLSLLREQAQQRRTVAFRIYNERLLIFYLIYQGEAMGSYQLRGNVLELAGELGLLLREGAYNIDMLEEAPPEPIETHSSQALSPAQAALLTRASSCVMQFLGTISGYDNIVSAARKVLESATAIFPCLQRLTVSQSHERIEVSWTFDQTQAFVTRSEAQTAINFVLAAMVVQHNDLFNRDTLRELLRRALQNNSIDLKREHLTLDCLAV